MACGPCYFEEPSCVSLFATSTPTTPHNHSYHCKHIYISYIHTTATSTQPPHPAKTTTRSHYIKPHTATSRLVQHLHKDSSSSSLDEVSGSRDVVVTRSRSGYGFNIRGFRTFNTSLNKYLYQHVIVVGGGLWWPIVVDGN